MSTRSTIAAKIDNGYVAVYCHHDGYPSYNGRILLTCYNTQEKIEELLKHGFMSSLDETIDKCEFYHNESPSYAPTYEQVVRGNRQEYNYLWENGQWYVDGEPLTLEMCERK